MFVEEGFRIRFANGEVIDFYADNPAQKDEWMKVLSDVVGKDVAASKGWAAMVLEKERKEKARDKAAPQLAQAKALQQQPNFSQPRPRSHEGVGSKSVPPGPVKAGHSRTQSHAPAAQAPPPLEKDARHRPAVGRAQTGSGNRRDQVKSMIF